MKKVYAVFNFIIVLALIYWNYWSNTGAINGNTVGDVSAMYANYFTPAAYAFSIWGLIFIGLLVITINQLFLAFKESKKSESIMQIGPWLSIANIGNALWLWFWLHKELAFSVIIMLIILFALIQIILRTNMEKWDAPIRIIATVWWPICLYSGWITVALIANIAAWLSKIEWVVLFTEIQWTIIMISVAGVINLLMIYYRNMREFAAVGLWALIAIAFKHWGVTPILQWTALFWAAILAIAITVHAYKNRSTNPLQKLFKT